MSSDAPAPCPACDRPRGPASCGDPRHTTINGRGPCPRCDRPLVDVEWDRGWQPRWRRDDECEGGDLCAGPSVDWRARALAAEAETARLRRDLDTTATDAGTWGSMLGNVANRVAGAPVDREQAPRLVRELMRERDQFRDATRRLCTLLASPPMQRVLEHAHDRATEEAPRRKADAADERLLYRAHYARMATEAREEIAAIEALQALAGEAAP